MRALGEALDGLRRNLMLARGTGLTATYNLVNDPACKDSDILELRRLHEVIDESVFDAYGWRDLSVERDFYQTSQGLRFTIDAGVRQEVLDRLLKLNHKRHNAQQDGNETPTQDRLL
jgi:hypothetical protein